MTDQEIIDNAPEGATGMHFYRVVVYLKCDTEACPLYWSCLLGKWIRWADMESFDFLSLRSLSDIKSGLEKNQRIAELEAELESVGGRKAVIASAIKPVIELESAGGRKARRIIS